MNINPVGNGPAQGIGHGRGPGQAGESGGQAQIQPGSAPQIGAQGKANGVIRLLQEGHFRGVADVRLRINFAEQLGGVQAASQSAAAGGDVVALLSAVNTIVGDFLEAGELDESVVEQITAAQTTFNDGVSSLVEQFQGGEISESELVESIQLAFDEFDASLTGLDPPVVPSPADGGEGDLVASSSTAETVEISLEGATGGAIPGFSDFLDALREAFSNAFSDFQASLSDAGSSLPELSEPNGNGAAYAKFVQILDGLNGDTSPAEDTTASDAPEVDTEI